MFGRIIKGDSNTLFQLEIDLGTGPIKRQLFVPNQLLRRDPGAYKLALDALTLTLEQNIKAGSIKEMETWQ